MRIAGQQPLNDRLIFFTIQGAGGIHQRPARAQSMEGAVDKLALSGGDVEVALRRPVFSASASLRTTLRRSKGRQAGWHRRFRARPRQNPAVEVGQSDVADAAAADVSMQHLHPAGGEFIGENAARVAHSGCNLGGFRSRAAATSITRSGCRLSANRAATGSIELAS